MLKEYKLREGKRLNGNGEVLCGGAFAFMTKAALSTNVS